MLHPKRQATSKLLNLQLSPQTFVSRIPKKPLSEIDLSTLTTFVLTAEEEEHFNQGIALFNTGKFWEAHEAWEFIWQQHPEDGRFFIQGLIQLAAAYHQLRRRIFRGAAIHLRQAEERLKLFPASFLGINIATLLEVIRESLDEIDTAPSLGAVDFSRIRIPRIEPC
jgi:uncharacterized protein